MNTTNHLPINPALFNGVWYPEKYSIKDRDDAPFFKRVDAIRALVELSKGEKVTLTLMINGYELLRFNSYGNYKGVYRPELDFVTSPKLKQMFIDKGYSISSKTVEQTPKAEQSYKVVVGKYSDVKREKYAYKKRLSNEMKRNAKRAGIKHRGFVAAA